MKRWSRRRLRWDKAARQDPSEGHQRRIHDRGQNPSADLRSLNPQRLGTERQLLDIFESPLQRMIGVLAALLKRDSVIAYAEDAVSAMAHVLMVNAKCERIGRGQMRAERKNQECAKLGFTSKCHFHTS